jgi:hypothetical protein
MQTVLIVLVVILVGVAVGQFVVHLRNRATASSPRNWALSIIALTIALVLVGILVVTSTA